MFLAAFMNDVFWITVQSIGIGAAARDWSYEHRTFQDAGWHGPPARPSGISRGHDPQPVPSTKRTHGNHPCMSTVHVPCTILAPPSWVRWVEQSLPCLPAQGDYINRSPGRCVVLHGHLPAGRCAVDGQIGRGRSWRTHDQVVGQLLGGRRQETTPKIIFRG